MQYIIFASTLWQKLYNFIAHYDMHDNYQLYIACQQMKQLYISVVIIY